MNSNNGEVEGGLKRQVGGLIIFLPLKRGAYKRGGLFEGGGGVGELNRRFTVLKQSQLVTE